MGCGAILLSLFVYCWLLGWSLTLTNIRLILGTRVLNDPVQEDSIWMNGQPIWTYLNLALGTPDEAAWEPLKRMSENFRMGLRDMWNLRALTHTDGYVAPAETTRPIEQGAPREQGHYMYGFMLTDLYLLPLLSGQVPDLPAGKLALAPKYPAPYGPSEHHTTHRYLDLT